MNYYPPQSNYAPQPYYPPVPPKPGGSRTVLIIGLGLVGVGILVASALAIYFARVIEDSNPFSLNTQELVRPEIGQCTAATETIVDWSAVVADCSDPEATMKIVASELAAVGNVAAECSTPDKLVIVDGRVNGDYTVVHACAAPNLEVGRCYSGGIGGFQHVSGCADGGIVAQLDRVVPGVTDTSVCETTSTDVTVEISYIFVRSMHFIDRREGSTYCFAPLPG
ncbi:hypothetical protein [Nocardia mangyaensis]|uniref:hypothetical protein n=1 Tax=Nocardia mangyaensis TaxID=2213200 RepID=UPI002675879E|nr:hypothetical protein [Nocardia mangyaensis]MDO3645340.1 hypothetical protein [Nocardia mangyaensis]